MMTHAGNAPRLVYVRRKPDTEPPPPPPASTPPGDATRKPLDFKESKIPKPPPPLPISNPTSQRSSCSFQNLMLAAPTKVIAKHWEERFCQLNNSLKRVDQSDQKDYIHMLRSLSSVELSKHAVELEKRSIQLSLEEAKELQRVRVLDVLERYSKHSRVPSTDQDLQEKRD